MRYINYNYPTLLPIKYNCMDWLWLNNTSSNLENSSQIKDLHSLKESLELSDPTIEEIAMHYSDFSIIVEEIAKMWGWYIREEKINWRDVKYTDVLEVWDYKIVWVKKMWTTSIAWYMPVYDERWESYDLIITKWDTELKFQSHNSTDLPNAYPWLWLQWTPDELQIAFYNNWNFLELYSDGELYSRVPYWGNISADVLGSKLLLGKDLMLSKLEKFIPLIKDELSKKKRQ